MIKITLFLFVILYSNILSASTIKDATEASARGEHETAFKILLPLAESGDVNALGNVGNKYAFGLGVKQDFEKAYHYWSLAADKHLATAMFNIATLHASGKGGLAKDFSQAVVWYQKAANYAHTRAMINLSTMYATGQLLKKDIKKATAWAAIAANYERSKKLKKVYLSQFSKLMTGLSSEEKSAVQIIVNELENNIKKNINKFRSQF